MSSTDRPESRDSERRLLRHKQSGSIDYGKALVPMWDSSDPERAPPPLPLNPSSPIGKSRPNTSFAIQSAHVALAEKARENSLEPAPLIKRIEQSPEKKSAAHKRMQSLQTGHVRDLSKFIEGGLSPTKSPERATPVSTPKREKKEDDNTWYRPPETDSNASTLVGGADMMSVRPSLRKPPQSILGENTPPQSSTMLALQSMSSRESIRDTKDHVDPLANVTNNSTAVVRQPQTFDAISGQILSLTSIATSLQREMAQLNRRSKDNATDLVSLKEATNARDEDIRKSLRELSSHITRPGSASPFATRERDSFLLDDKPHTPQSRGLKTLSLPRIPSPTSFAAGIDRGMAGTPGSTYAPDSSGGSAATVALLEKVLRDMGTKEGLEDLVDRLAAISSRLARDNDEINEKMEEVIDMVKKNESNRALMVAKSGGASSRDVSFGKAPKFDDMVPLTNKDNGVVSAPASAAFGDELVELVKTVKSVKDSVTHSGGLTAEVKASVRDLRGEVLGMGRDLGKKLAIQQERLASKDGVDPEEITRIVDDSLHDLKQHLTKFVQDSVRQSSGSLSSKNSNEIFNAVKHAMAEVYEPGLAKEDIIEAVRVAWENHKPEIEVQHFGLEREEMLTCLKEGIQECMPLADSTVPGATRDEVFVAVVEAFKQFNPPRIEPEPSLSREEILDAVRECLEEFEFPAAPMPEPRGLDVTRDEMVEAVREGLEGFEFPSSQSLSAPVYPVTREDMLEAVREGLTTFDFSSIVPHADGKQLTRDDVLDAVHAGLQSFDFPIPNTQANELMRSIGDSLTKEDVYEAVRAGFEKFPQHNSEEFESAVTERLQEILEVIAAEFKAVSDEAKDNVAAHGRDTEQVLDATKDGFDKLRGDIEAYFERAANGTSKDEILHAIRDNFDDLSEEISQLLTVKGPALTVEALKVELESLRDVMASQMANQVVLAGEPSITGPTGTKVDTTELLTALRDGLEDIRHELEKPKINSSESMISQGTEEVLDALADGFENLRSEVERLVSKPVDMTVSYEILDTLRAGIESLRLDIDRLKEEGISVKDSDSSRGAGELAAITSGTLITSAGAADGLKRDDIENLEGLINQLRTKVENLENMAPPTPVAVPGTVMKEDLDHMEETLKATLQNYQTSMVELSRSQVGEDAEEVKREDIQAIETLLRNTKDKIDDLSPEDGVKKEHLESIEQIITEVRDSANELLSYVPETVKKEDVINIEGLVKDVMVMLQDIKEASENDGNVAIVVLEVKEKLEKMIAEDLTTLATKEDFNTLSEQISKFMESDALELANRQVEIATVGESVTEVKVLLGDLQDAIKAKIDESAAGVESINTVLGGLILSLEPNSKISEEVKELLDTVVKEFEQSNAGVVGAKLETDENFTKTWEKIDEKFADLLIKYDDAQLAAEAKAKATEEQTADIQTALSANKEIAEELKSIIDLLGTTLTDSVEKMEEASKTVFTRVDETYKMLEEAQLDVKTEGTLTRDDIAKTLTAVEGIKTELAERQPEIHESVKDVLHIVGEHFEHAKAQAEALEQKLKDQEEASRVSVAGLIASVPQPETYDDSNLHLKLDQLVDHMHTATKSFAQLEMLDEIHKKVMQTAAEVSHFVAKQTLRIANDHEDKVKEAEEAALALERRLAEKERVEADIASRCAEEQQIRDELNQLKAERKLLYAEKMSLTAEIAGLNTGVQLRREECKYLEGRAEHLERRIMESVIDQSRAFLINKSKPRDVMNLKRVPSYAPSMTESTVSSSTVRSRPGYSAANSAVGMALKAPGPMRSQSNAANSPRRNFSLNTIPNNGQTSPFKRSASVREPTGARGLRKATWAGDKPVYGELNKENLAVKESVEEVDAEEELADDGHSEAGTLRRQSYGQGDDAYSEYTETESGYTEYTGSVYTETESGYTYADSQYTETPGEEDEKSKGLVKYEAA